MDDDQSDGHKFFPVYLSMENKEFAEYDEQDTSDSIVRFYNDGDDDDDDDDDDDEPEVAAGIIKEPTVSLLPTIAKTVGKVIF